MFVAAAADAAVFVAVEMFALPCCLLLPVLVTRPSAAGAGPCNVVVFVTSFFSSGDSTATVTALQSGRSPHGGGQPPMHRSRPQVVERLHAQPCRLRAACYAYIC